MFKVHQYLQQLRIQVMMTKVSVVQEDIQRVSLLLPSEMNPLDKKR